MEAPSRQSTPVQFCVSGLQKESNVCWESKSWGSQRGGGFGGGPVLLQECLQTSILCILPILYIASSHIGYLKRSKVLIR